MNDEFFLRRAIALAHEARLQGEVPMLVEEGLAVFEGYRFGQGQAAPPHDRPDG